MAKKPRGSAGDRGSSDRLCGKDERRRAKQDLRNDREPQPKYTTGKFWLD